MAFEIICRCECGHEHEFDLDFGFDEDDYIIGRCVQCDDKFCEGCVSLLVKCSSCGKTICENCTSDTGGYCDVCHDESIYQDEISDSEEPEQEES